jgi:hypothetical protein
MTLNSNATKNQSYPESGRLAQGGKRAFSFCSCEIYGLRERSINSPEVGPDSVLRPVRYQFCTPKPLHLRKRFINAHLDGLAQSAYEGKGDLHADLRHRSTCWSEHLEVCRRRRGDDHACWLRSHNALPPFSDV